MCASQAAEFFQAHANPVSVVPSDESPATAFPLNRTLGEFGACDPVRVQPMLKSQLFEEGSPRDEKIIASHRPKTHGEGMPHSKAIYGAYAPNKIRSRRCVLCGLREWVFHGLPQARVGLYSAFCNGLARQGFFKELFRAAGRHHVTCEFLAGQFQLIGHGRRVSNPAPV